MKIYTKTGDSGSTGLFAGPRVSKDHPRISAYGSVDELNASLGLVRCELSTLPSELIAGIDNDRFIIDIQSDLFSIGAELATPQPEAHGMCLLKQSRIAEVEGFIDAMEEQLPPLAEFILPGGTRLAAVLHMARTICRRAERDIVHLSREADVHDCSLSIVYLNRLSDLLFVASRRVNHSCDTPETKWHRPD